MGGFFGIASEDDCILRVFYGTDYHSHLGTKIGGMSAYSKRNGFQREIHNIKNAPFRTRFEGIAEKMGGRIAMGCISDLSPQPLLIRSKLGVFSICIEGAINNTDFLVDKILESGMNHFETMGGGEINPAELVGAIISEKDNFVDGILHAQDLVEGTLSILIMKEDGIIASRDKFGRIPMIIGRNGSAHCVSFESFAHKKLGFEDYYEVGPGEIVEINSGEMKRLSPPRKEMKICSFLWVYYGYPNSNYEGVNVETMRNKNGELMADLESDDVLESIDFISGVPDSGVPHAIGFSNNCSKPFKRPFIKYTPTWPRSFIPNSQDERGMVAKMKIIPVNELIKDKKILLIDDSIVRGTQLGKSVDLLYSNGAKEVHMRSASPPYMYVCPYLNPDVNNSNLNLLTRRVIMELEGEEGFKHIDEYRDSGTERGRKMREIIAEKYGFTSLEFQSVENTIKAIGIDREKLCTYCWTGKK